MNLSPFPGMTVQGAHIIIHISDADSDRHPITFLDEELILTNHDGVYYTIADDTTRNKWLHKIGGLLDRSGPGIDDGKHSSCFPYRAPFSFSFR